MIISFRLYLKKYDSMLFKSLLFSATFILISGNIFAQFNANLTYGTLTDIDGNKYKTIKIGKQIWMAENLRVSRYNSGRYIDNITDNKQWEDDRNGGWCYYEHDATKNTPYGKLYNWYAVSNTNQLCPAGWHIPSDLDWDILIANLNPPGSTLKDNSAVPLVGGIMKSTGTAYWYSPNAEATNNSGFSALPGGYRTIKGQFYSMGSLANWWSISEYNVLKAWSRYIGVNGGSLHRFNYEKEIGLSVRCLRY